MANGQNSPALDNDGRPRRRVIPIVDARFQWKYTLAIMAFGVALSAIMGGFIYKAHVDNTRLLDIASNPRLQSEVMRGDYIVLLALIVTVVVMGVGLGFWGLITTHRIVGPLYIVARYLDVLSDGRYPDLRPLRKRDELQEFFSVFEDAVNMMRNRDRMALKDLEGALADAKKSLDGGDTKAAMQNIVGVLEKQRDVLAGALGDDEA